MGLNEIPDYSRQAPLLSDGAGRMGFIDTVRFQAANLDETLGITEIVAGIERMAQCPEIFGERVITGEMIDQAKSILREVYRAS